MHDNTSDLFSFFSFIV